jgi:hypothetical protein
MLGGDVIWREAILELVQPGCYQEYRKGLQVLQFIKGLSWHAVRLQYIFCFMFHFHMHLFIENHQDY